MNGLNDSERKLVVQFLHNLGARMGNAGCNDYELDDTPENRALLQAAYECGNKDEPFDINKHVRGNTLLCMDFIIVGYLADKLSQLTGHINLSH